MMEKDRQERTKLLFLGDFMLGGEFLEKTGDDPKKLRAPFQQIIPLINNADIVVANLEGPIFVGPEKRNDITSILSNHPLCLEILKSFGRECVLDLANNHVMDYGPNGLRETIRQIDNQGMYYLGAGENIGEAEKAIKINYNGIKIGFLAYTSDQPSVGALIASNTTPGCSSLLDMEVVREHIESLSCEVDIVCVLLHWGLEFYEYPSPDQVSFARSLIDTGAHIVIGHHPHVQQGIEQYKNGLIAYSLGNFFLPPVRAISGRIQLRKRKTKRFLTCSIEITKSALGQVTLLSGWMEDDYALIPSDMTGKARLDKEMEELSRPIIEPDYEAFWERYQIKREKELKKENLREAFQKAKAMSIGQLLQTVSWKDIKINIRRIADIVGSLTGK
jgi:hypothetical protein